MKFPTNGEKKLGKKRRNIRHTIFCITVLHKFFNELYISLYNDNKL